MDLGSGSGVPGLIIAWALEQAEVVLVESNARRANFLHRAATFLDLDSRIQILCERAELVGREPTLRERADVVVARSFGPPATTAECGSALVRVGGHLVVSDPPRSSALKLQGRWETEPLLQLGLVPVEIQRSRSRFSFAVLQKVVPLSDSFPRRVGVPAKRPLWG